MNRALKSVCACLLGVLAVGSTLPAASHAVGWDSYIYIEFHDRTGKFGPSQHLGTNWSYPEWTDQLRTCIAAWDVASSSWAGEVPCARNGVTKEYDRRYVRVPWAGGGEGYGPGNRVSMTAHAFHWDY